MCVGCFSWCPLPRWGVKKQGVVEKSSENFRSIVPIKTEYTAGTGKEVLTLLQSADGVMPVPLLQDAIGVALKVIQLCEDASVVEQKVKKLQERVGHLMIAILHHVTPENEEGSEEVVVKTLKVIDEDIKELVSILGTINLDLTEIRLQERWAIEIYKELNANKLEDCISRLSTALERFKLANDLHDPDLLQNLQPRLERVAHKVDDIDNKVEDIHKYLFGSKRSTTLLPSPSDTSVRQQMPMKPEVFHGRDALVKDVVRLFLQEKTSRVCILGPGGIGKTSASLAVVESSLLQERFPLGNCVWVPCIEATSATLLLEILYIQLQIPGDEQVTFERIISELDASTEPRLILLDNFETPWNASGERVSDILRKLAELRHIAIFITMRGTNPPCDDAIKWQSKIIQPPDEEACLRIYHDINPHSHDDPDVRHLLTVLGHMPFAVTLIAKLGVDAQSTAKELLDAWLESGPDILPDTPEKSMNRSISLSVESDLVKRNPNAILLLATLSLLPAGTTKQNLRWWAPTLKTSMVHSAIATLSGVGLLVENKQQNSDSPVLFVVPVVQSFMQQNDQDQRPRIPEEVRKQLQSSCCQYILDHACRPLLDPTFPIKSKALAAEDTNIQSILFGSPPLQRTVLSDRTMEALIAFSWHRCDAKPSLEIVNHAVTAAKAFGVDRYVASAVWCLGKTYDRIGDHRHSHSHLQEAYRLFNILAGEVESQRLGGHCGIDLVSVTRVTLQDKTKAVSLARDVEMKCSALSDDFLHGRSLYILGAALNDAGQPQEALVHLYRARDMLSAVGNTPGLAATYQIIARSHYNERRLPQALDAVQEAWKHIESSTIANQQAYISLEFGKILFSADRDVEAWKYIEIALMKASYIGNRHEIAKALEYMGYGYLRRGDYENAYGAYEAAAEKYLGTVSVLGDGRCKENMARIKKKQGNTDAVIGFYRHGYDVDSSLFYPPIEAPENNIPISGS